MKHDTEENIVYPPFRQTVECNIHFCIGHLKNSHYIKNTPHLLINLYIKQYTYLAPLYLAEKISEIKINI